MKPLLAASYSFPPILPLHFLSTLIRNSYIQGENVNHHNTRSLYWCRRNGYNFEKIASVSVSFNDMKRPNNWPPLLWHPVKWSIWTHCNYNKMRDSLLFFYAVFQPKKRSMNINSQHKVRLFDFERFSFFVLFFSLLILHVNLYVDVRSDWCKALHMCFILSFIYCSEYVTPMYRNFWF